MRSGRPAARHGGTGYVWLAAVGVLALAYLFRGLVVPLVLAATVAYLLNPIVTWVQGFGFRRTVVVAGLYLGLGLLVAAAVVWLGPRLKSEVVSLAERLPGLVDEVVPPTRLHDRLHEIADTLA